MESKVVKININGKDFEKSVSSNLLLIDFIREEIKLTGSHIGCDTNQCGSCMVLSNEISLKSCSVLAIQMDGARIKTIEGISNGEALHPMQESFREHHGLQCGFCTPGMVMSAVDLLKNKKNPSDQEIREWLEGNICRCTGYHNIVAAVKEAASKM